MSTKEPSSPQKSPQTPEVESPPPASEAAMPTMGQSVGAPPPLTPGTLRYLQRTIGNSAVQRLLNHQTNAQTRAHKVQRSTAPASPMGPEGGALSGDIESRLRRSQSGGSSLPNHVRGAIEPKLGADLSTVKVHTDRTAVQLNRDLGAKAFTHGNHIYYGAGHSPHDLKLTAHEAVHTVQQGGVRAKRIQTKLMVGPANDRYEAEADEIANEVMRSPQTPIQRSVEEFVPRVQRLQRMPHTVIQRFSLNPMKWTKKGREKAEAKEKSKKERQEKQQADTNALLSLASVFERNLGKYLFNDGRAKQTASTLADKMIAALIPEMDASSKEHQTLVAQAFGKDAKQYAGNVGTEFADVWAAMKQGNLREKMTGVYNAMFGPFKTLMTRLMSEKAWDEAKTRGLDTRKLKIRKRQLKWNPMAKDPYRKPRAFFDRKKVKTFEFSFDMLKSETRNLKDGSKVTDRTAGELDEGQFKTGLSERERKFMFPNKKDDENISDETLSWEEGGSTWDMKKNHKWVKTLTQNLKMPVMAGPSGTAQRFFQVYEWLGKPVDAKHLRMALLGWMLVENDHSFHEIAQMGVEYGVPYTPGHAAYRNLDPLTEAEIRKNVNRDPKYPGLFPDEIHYHKKMDAGEYALMKPYMDDMQEKSEHSPLTEEQFGMKKGAFDKSGLKHALRPVTAYTTIAYQTINMVAGGNPTFTKIRLNKMLKTARTKHSDILEAYRILYVEGKTKGELGDVLYKKYKKAANDDLDDLSFAEKNMIFVLAENPAVTAEEIISEAKIHREHINSGLELLPTFQGKVYRGEAQNVGGQSYKKGTKVTIKKFLSASRNSGSAASYAKSSAGISGDGNKWYSFLRKPFVLEMESKTARDVNAITVNEDEEVRQKTEDADLDEVVFLPGTVLEVQSNPEPDPAFDNIPKVVLKETKGGGVSDPNQRIEYNQVEVSGPRLEDEDDSSVGGVTYEANRDLNIGKNPGDYDATIPADEQFQVMEPGWDMNYVDPELEWTEIYYNGQQYYIIKYDLLMDASEVRAPKKVPKDKPKPGPIKLCFGPDETGMGFELPYDNRDEITSHKPYDLAPGWSIVEHDDGDEEYAATFYAVTEDLLKFLSGGQVEDVDLSESEASEGQSVGLDKRDYPAGQQEVTIKAPINLPAANTPDGEYTTNVELFQTDKIPVFIEDDLTEKYGRCRIVFFSQTYYVPLTMLISPVDRVDELDVVDVDEEDFVPEHEGAQLKVFEGVMDLDPESDKSIFEKAHFYNVPYSELGDISEYEERDDWIVLIHGSRFIYALTADWIEYQKG